MNDTFALLKTNDAIGSDPTRLIIDYEALESRAAELAEM